MKVIILAGGSGTRLWPFSRHSFPKQFLHFGDDYSLLQKTIKRSLQLVEVRDILIVTNQEYYHHVQSQAAALNQDLVNQILVEPERKNTGPAILLAMKYCQEILQCPESECVLISSSDHFISPEEVFVETIHKAEQTAKQGYHVIFGIHPHKPETGYGYIKANKKEADQNDAYPVERFVEKPSLDQAQNYFLSGDYLWNSGVFLFKIQTFIEEMRQCSPQLMEYWSCTFKEMVAHFSDFPEISIDYALMEHSRCTMVLPLHVSWSDVGSWDSVYDVLDKDPHRNVKMGNVLDIDTKNCLIMGSKRLISTIGLDDLLIIETEDALFIGKKGESQRVKFLVEELKKRKAKESIEHITTHRPWGEYTVLEEGDRYKIKRIVVNPLQRLSLQMHYHRSEHWVVIKGTAKVTIGVEEQLIHENESIYVPKSMVHRLENPGKVLLELIEVQVGEYVGEDDIVRMRDDYSRV